MAVGGVGVGRRRVKYPPNFERKWFGPRPWVPNLDSIEKGGVFLRMPQRAHETLLLSMLVRQ